MQNQSFLSAINPNQIENIDVINRDTLIDNIYYYGQIFIKIKSDYTPKFISLTDFKAKYTDLKEKPVLFTLDGNFINADYDKYIIDENSLLTIIIDKLEMNKEKIELGLVKLLTKSEENIKARNKIILRGLELTKKE